MRVLQINSAPGWGGGEEHTLLLSLGLIARKQEVFLACRPESVIEKRFRDIKIPVFQLPLKGAADLISAHKLRHFCVQNNIDIIHAHLSRDYWPACWATLGKENAKLIITRHLLYPIKKNYFSKKVFQRANACIAVSRAVKNVLLNLEPIDQNKIMTVHNGIDTQKFSLAPAGKLRLELNVAPNQKLLGVVGQVAPHKGQEILIRSIKKVVERFSDFLLLIVGGDSENGAYIERLKTIADEEGLSQYIRFLGKRNDIPEIMKDLDIFVLPSLEEAFGLVLVEAMAANTAVIASNIGGVGEIVTEETGRLIKPNDTEILAEEIVDLLLNPKKVDDYKQKGYCRANKYFDVDTMVNNTLEIYLNS